MPPFRPDGKGLVEKSFDFSGGIPAYIIKIFQETQAQALLQGEARISERVMQRAIDILAIKVPKTYSGGTYISDFEVNDAGANEAPPAQVPAELPRELTAESPEPVPRLYANQRGRKAAATETEYALTEALQRNTLCSFWTFLPRRFSPARPLR